VPSTGYSREGSEQGLRGLPAAQRRALFLRAILGYSAAQTADALGASVAAVNSALQRARAALKGTADH
jgi:RNA polymerase sigma-70 factor (ECF subfamily)